MFHSHCLLARLLTVEQTITGPTTWLMGDVFLKNVYSSFDFDKSQIGFGKRASPNGTVNRPTPITSVLLSNPTNTIPVLTPTTGHPPASSNDSGSNNGNKSAAVGGFTVPFVFVLGGFFLGLVMV